MENTKLPYKRIRNVFYREKYPISKYTHFYFKLCRTLVKMNNLITRSLNP